MVTAMEGGGISPAMILRRVSSPLGSLAFIFDFPLMVDVNGSKRIAQVQVQRQSAVDEVPKPGLLMVGAP
jgi:hypothetical protein